MQQTKRMAFIVIIFPKGSRALLEVISILSKFESILLGSIQVPDQGGKSSIFGILAKATTDQIGALTGPLGKIYGIKVKSAVLPDDKGTLKHENMPTKG